MLKDVDTVKHSDCTELKIKLFNDSEFLYLNVTDNGKGFDSKDNSKYEGIGLKNIRTRVEYLKGSVEFDSKPGKGTLVAIHIPAMIA